MKKSFQERNNVLVLAVATLPVAEGLEPGDIYGSLQPKPFCDMLRNP